MTTALWFGCLFVAYGTGTVFCFIVWSFSSFVFFAVIVIRLILFSHLVQVIFFTFVARKAQLVIVAISRFVVVATFCLVLVSCVAHPYPWLLSAFFWLISLMAASILWYIIPPLQTTYGFFVPIGVIIQEVFRYIYFRFYE